MNKKWKHIAGLQLADPEFGTPGRIDLVLGIDVVCEARRFGRRRGPPGTPWAFNTCFGWVLAGEVQVKQASNTPVSSQAAVCCTSVLSTDELLKKFWEVERCDLQDPALSVEEKAVVQHFNDEHHKDETGRFVVPLPMKSDAVPLGESRAMAVKRFHALERSLERRSQADEFHNAVLEYFEMDHVEQVPSMDLAKPHNQIFYMPMHAVVKASRTTTKLRVVFDASAKSASGSSLNDQLMVGPTVHSSLVDVLLRFRCKRIALSTDVSRMYRAVLLPVDQRDLHRFVWRMSPQEPLIDYRMTRLTFGVAASSFAANMAVKQNALDQDQVYPQAAEAVLNSFYVDDGLTGANTVAEAIQLREQLQRLFDSAGFILRKWKSNSPRVLSSIPSELLDQQPCQEFYGQMTYTKVLGVEWNAKEDLFRPLVDSSSFCSKEHTKRGLMSDIARIYDILGWCSPTIIKLKILLQRLWEERLEWDQAVPDNISQVWQRWRNELPLLGRHHIPRCYFQESTDMSLIQLHGFSDASELAYAAVVYIRMPGKGEDGCTALVMAKTKVAPVKRLSIPRLELCGAVLLSRLLSHIAKVLSISAENIWAWTDSLVVLSWLQGNPRRFKPFVGNRVSESMDLIPPSSWHHVSGHENPADPASRGLFPSELAQCHLWWNGPQWLRTAEASWPSMPSLISIPVPSEERDAQCLVAYEEVPAEIGLIERFSSYDRLKRVTAWIFRFTRNCSTRTHGADNTRPPLSTEELQRAERCWIKQVQLSTYASEIDDLKKGKQVSRSSKLLSLHPFLDSQSILRVGGRIQESELDYPRRHPIILPGSHHLTRLLVRMEHLRLLHAGPTLVAASLSRRFHLVRGRSTIRAVIHECVVCQRVTAKAKPQIMGQLPSHRLEAGSVFKRVGVDYAGPILTKSGPVRRPIINKTYVAVFVCFAVKAVHLELVSDLTTAAFIAALRRFVSRRGKPSTIWSDHGTNFVGAAHELRELYAFWKAMENRSEVIDFCAGQNIEWKFVPEKAPHFGGLWEAAVKSFKGHLRKVVGETKLTYEELETIMSQIEACLNSRPLTALPEATDGIEVLTPGHFLIGRPLQAVSDQPPATHPISLLRRWRLCQALFQHYWTRWSDEYLCHLRRFAKWHDPARNPKVGDVVCLRGEPMVPGNWTIARIVMVHPGKDGKVRVVTVKTPKGIYKRPLAKVVPLVEEPE